MKDLVSLSGMAELASLVQRLEVAVGRLESMSGSGGSAGAPAGGGKVLTESPRSSVVKVGSEVLFLMDLHLVRTLTRSVSF